MTDYLSINEVIDLLPVSRRTWFRRTRHDPSFPRSVIIGGREFWQRDLVEAYRDGDWARLHREAVEQRKQAQEEYDKSLQVINRAAALREYAARHKAKRMIDDDGVIRLVSDDDRAHFFLSTGFEP